MIDLINFIVGCFASFALGFAAHSIYLHEKKRHSWKFPWDHNKEEEK